MNEQLFHIYIGTAYQGAQRAPDAERAIARWARWACKSRLIFRAEPARSVQQLKQRKEKNSAAR